jgi:hypothetical protein
MKQVKQMRPSVTHHSHSSIERRRIARTPVSFGLMYSGLNEDDVLLGDGTVVDLSEGGLGIRGNSPVQVGMELTLFLYLPNGEDPLFILEGIVTWTKDYLFGISLKEHSLLDGDRLRSFLFAQSVGQA